MKQFCKTVLFVASPKGQTYTFFAHRVVLFVCWFIFVFFGFEVSVFLSVCFGLIFKIMKNSVAPVTDLFV